MRGEQKSLSEIQGRRLARPTRERVSAPQKVRDVVAPDRRCVVELALAAATPAAESPAGRRLRKLVAGDSWRALASASGQHHAVLLKLRRYDGGRGFVGL